MPFSWFCFFKKHTKTIFNKLFQKSVFSHYHPLRSLFRHFFPQSPSPWNCNTIDILHICSCIVCTSALYRKSVWFSDPQEPIPTLHLGGNSVPVRMFFKENKSLCTETSLVTRNLPGCSVSFLHLHVFYSFSYTYQPPPRCIVLSTFSSATTFSERLKGKHVSLLDSHILPNLAPCPS